MFGRVETQISSYRLFALVLNFMVCLSFLGRLSGLRFEVQMDPQTSILRSKCPPGSSILRSRCPSTNFWELEGYCWEIWSSWDVLWSSSRALRALGGVVGPPGHDIGKHFGMNLETLFFPCCACCGSQHLALFRSFLGRSGLHRSRSSQNGSDRFHSKITN